MTTYGLQTVHEPDPEDAVSPVDGERDDVIDVISVHGLSNFHEDMWRPESHDRAMMTSDLFGFYAYRVRFSVYRYKPTVSPARVLVSHGIREEASRLLEAIVELKKGDTKAPQTVFLAYDFGAAIVKQVLIDAAFGDGPSLEVFSSTRAMLLYGCCNYVEPDCYVQEFFSRLLQEDGRFRALKPRYSDCGLAIDQAMTEVNYRFLDTKAPYRGMGIVSVWSSSGDLDADERALSEHEILAHTTYISSEPHAELLRNAQHRLIIQSSIRYSLDQPPSDSVEWESRAKLLHEAPDVLSGHIRIRDLSWDRKAAQLDHACIFDSHTFKTWEAGQLRSILYVRVPDTCLAQPVVQRMTKRLYLQSLKRAFNFEFLDWDQRRNSVEKCLLQFLVFMASSSIAPGDIPIDYSQDLTDGLPWAWSLDMIFRRVVTILQHESSSDKTTTWILSNLNEKIVSHDWFVKSIGALLADTDIRLNVLVVNADGAPSLFTSPTTLFLDTPAVQSGPADIDEATPGNPTSDTTDQTEGQKIPALKGGAMFDPAELAHEVVQLLESQPGLYPLRHALNEVFVRDADDDPEMRELLFNWFKSLSTQASQSKVEDAIASLYPYTRSLAFQRVLEYTLSESEAAKQARWVLELVAHAVRPLSVFEMEDLDELLSGFETAVDIPKLQISRYGASLNGLIKVVNHEVYFSHRMLRDYLLAPQDGSPLALGEASAAARSHARIAIACLEYLSSSKDLGQFTDHTDEAMPAELPNFLESSGTFLSYAVRNWTEHAKLSEGAFSDQREYVEKLLQRSVLDTWATHYQRVPARTTRETLSKVSAVAMLAECGLAPMIDVILELRPGPLTDEELIHGMEQAAKAGEADVVRKLMALRGSDEPVPLALATASIISHNETLIAELFERTSLTNEDHAEIAKAFARAAAFGLVAVMKTLLPHLPVDYGWSEVVQYASVGNNADVMELVYDAMVARSSSAATESFDVAEGSQLLADALVKACRRGQSDVAAFLVAKKCTLIQEVDDTTDYDQETPWSDTFGTALRKATQSGQANVLATLLASTDDLPEGYIQDVSSCATSALYSAMVGCSKCLLEHVAAQLPAEELRDKASAVMASKQTSLLDLFLGFTGRHLDSDGLTNLWALAKLLTDESVPILGYLLDNYEASWSADERQRHLGEALCYAAHSGHNKLGAFLLDRGASPEYVDSELLERSATCYAVEQGNEELVEKLISKGTNVNARVQRYEWREEGPESWPLVSLSLWNPGIVRLLIKAGADINATIDRPGDTSLWPVLDALLFGQLESAKILIDSKCDVNVWDGQHNALSLAVMREAPDIVQLLLDAGADPTLQPAEKLRHPLLHLCVENALSDILKMLLAYDLTIDAPDAEGLRPLHCMSERTTPEVVKLLVNRGASVISTGGTFSVTPLTKAVGMSNLEVAKYLMSVGADVNLGESDGLTALHKACFSDRECAPDMLRLLLEAGADINAVCTGIFGTPFQTILEHGDRDPEIVASVTRLLLDDPNFAVNAESPWWGANINAACVGMGLNVVEELLQAGAKIHRKDRAGRQPIHFAAYRPVEFLQRLLKAGASIDAKDAMGRTLLHIAVLAGRLDVVKYILQERKKFANARDINEWTPLLWAVSDCGMWGAEMTDETQTAIIEELLACGASRVVQGHGHDRSWTALKLAAYHGLGEDITKLVTPSEEELQALDPNEQSRWRHEIGDEDRKARLFTGCCDFCFGTLRGFFYACDDCDNGFCLCFRCYRSQNLVHPEHDFNRQGENEYASDSEVDGPASGRSVSRSSGSSRSSHRSGGNDQGSVEENERSGEEDEGSGEEDDESGPDDESSGVSESGTEYSEERA